jgi:hypothetical protein
MTEQEQSIPGRELPARADDASSPPRSRLLAYYRAADDEPNQPSPQPTTRWQFALPEKDQPPPHLLSIHSQLVQVHTRRGRQARPVSSVPGE